jgi:muramoyltetrapeptide carboxypeptidase LdcA involved in peptidoglycan recycling
LQFIDWEVIKSNPKPIIGSSDITVLLNAIYAKTNIKTYFGPNFLKFGMKIGLDDTLKYFKECLFDNKKYNILPSKKWSDDNWYKNQDKRNFYNNDGFIICNPGTAKGKTVGGNLCSLNLLQGTEYMPSLKDSVLFIEDDDLAGENTFGEFNRNLQSLLQLPDAKKIKGILVGRFSQKCFMTKEKIKYIFQSQKELKNIPIIADVDFGHCDPFVTFPIGEKIEVSAEENTVKIKIR